MFEELEEQQNIKTPKEWMQIYQIEGNLCREKQGDILRAVSYYKKAYSVDGEKSLLLCIAINYRQYAVSNPEEIDLPFMDLAIQYFDMYLNEADDMVKRHFYKECGIAYINDCVLIGAFSSVLANIDGVLRQCKDPYAICDLRIVKANAAVELGCADPNIFTGISSWIRDSMLLHHECKMLGTRWTEYMDDKYSIEYDVEYTGRTDLKCLARVEEKGKQLEKEYRMLADKLMLLLGNPESDARYARPIYADLLDMFLILKSGDEFKEYLFWAENLYPYDCGICAYKRYISEAEGDYAAAESEIRKCLDQQFTLKTTKDALSFYTRNGKYHRIRELYKTILDSESDVGRYQRDVLILQYILYLTRPTANWLFALEEYLKYESEMEDDNFRQILEMKFRRYTNHYGEYEKWINISVFWMQTAPGKAEFQDAILLSVFNLKENDAKFYIELFRKQFESNTDENEIRSYFAPYFDLTGDNQCDEGQVSSLNVPKLDRQIECSRSPVYQSAPKWKWLRECGTAVIDSYSLYYLAKKNKLNDMMRVIPKLVVPYSVIVHLISVVHHVKDKNVYAIFQWLEQQENVCFYESGLEYQLNFRKKYGEQQWYLKSVFCISTELKIPMISALRADDIAKEAVEPNAIWLGDLLDILC